MNGGNDSIAPLNPCRFMTDFIEDPHYLHVPNIICSVFTSVFILPGILGNALVILAVCRTPSLQTPSTTLLLTLAASDLAVAVLAQPAFLTWRTAQLVGNLSVHCVAGVVSEAFGWLLAGVSLFTITAISCERLLAVHLHLRYHNIVTKKGVAKVAISFWLVWVIITITRFFFVNRKILRIIAINFLVITSGIMFVAYIIIFKLVRRHQAQIEQQCFIRSSRDDRNRRTIDMIRYRKSTITMLYILGFFLVCYFPFLIVMLIEVANGETLDSKAAYLYTVTFIFINSALNPIIYCWRMMEIRRAIQKIIHYSAANAIEPEKIFIASKVEASLE